MKLSICMMVKNEEKNIDRCLSSLNPILSKEDVELIIVDTGSDDKTVEIAKKYTQKMYFKEWENNFSEIRNYTISLASGEWLFILDGDEEVKDILTLYKLLYKDEIKNYNTISIDLYNFNKRDNYDSYVIGHQNRFFRNDGYFRFEGSVHNQQIYKEPILETNNIIYHYGYLVDDEELMEKKYKRTTNILKDELAKNPKDVYYNMQLAISYSMYGDFDNCYDQIEKTYNLMVDLKEIRLNVFFLYAQQLLRKQKYSRVIKICTEGLGYERNYLDLYKIRASAYFYLRNYDLSLKDYNKYLELFEKIGNLKISKNQSVQMYTWKESEKEEVIINSSKIYYFREDYKSAGQKIKLMRKKNIDYYSIYFNSMLKLKKYDTILNDILVMDTNEIEEKEIIDILETSILGEEEEIGNYREKISKAYNNYGLYNKFLLNENDDLFKIINDGIDFKIHSKYYANIYHDNIDLLFNKIKYLNTEEQNTIIHSFILNNCNDKESVDKYKVYFKDKYKKINPRDFQSNKTYMNFLNVFLLNMVQLNANKKYKLVEDDVLLFNNEFLISSNNYVEYIYNKDRVNIFYENLPNSTDKFILMYNLMIENVKKENFKMAIEYSRNIIEKFEAYSYYVKKNVESWDL